MCLAASPGGHLAEVGAARAAFEGWRRFWVTGASTQADALREEGEEVHVLPTWGRDPPGLRGFPANVRASGSIVRRRPAHVVVTTGAGLVVPYVLMARAARSEVFLLESMARVAGASLSGRIVAPLARAVLVQWPEMRGAYRQARVCRPVLLEPGPSRDAPAGRGTFVSVGTRAEPFGRLLEMVDRAVAAGILPGPVIAQSGSSAYRPAAYSTTPWLSPGEVERGMREARYVVCHGGAAMIAAAIGAGRRPLVLPRRRAAREHRTEHQCQMVDRLAAAGAVVALDREIGRREVALAAEPPPAADLVDAPSVQAALRSELVRLMP